MIYWPSTPGAEYTIAIPNHYGLTNGDVQGKQVHIHVRNNVGRWGIGSDGFDVDEVTPNWILLRLSNDDPMEEGALPPDGEYTYEAVLGDKTLSVGVMQFGEYTAERKEYEKPIEYEQYDN